jgi:periplasmic protein TonB
MFSFPETRSRRRGASLLFSLVIHCVVVFLWLHRAPIFVRPSSAAAGAHGVSELVTYFPSPPDSKPALKKKPPRVVFTPKAVVAEESPAKSAPAVGTEYGSVGSVTGTEARPAFSVVSPDPPIFPWQLPNGLTGDVIVEVTVDDQGAVTDTRLLQSLKPDIDDKVVATLRNWRFHPASVDGVAIPSRVDVHFHYPG